MPTAVSGYPDWQRIVDWDSPIQIAINTGLTNAAFASAIVDVSKYGYLAGQLSAQSSVFQVQIFWFADKAGQISVGVRQFYLDQLMGTPMRVNLLHLGPYMQVFINPLPGAASYSALGNLFSTNRATSLEFIPVNGIILDRQNIQLPAASQAFYPIDYWAGPIQVWAQSGGVTWELQLQVLSSSNVWEVAGNIHVPSDPGVFASLIVPPTVWRLVSTGTGAIINNNYLVVVPSVTGAA